MQCITFKNVDQFLAGTEKVFNVLGWIPQVSTVSGPIRATMGKVMVVAAAALAALTLAVGYITGNRNLFLNHFLPDIRLHTRCLNLVFGRKIKGNVRTFRFQRLADKL